MKAVLVPSALFDKVYQYLHEKPYREVSGLVDDLKQSVQIVDVPEEKEEEENDGAE